MEKTYTFIAVLNILTICCYSQNNVLPKNTYPIYTDRPGQSDSPLLLHPRSFQLETGTIMEVNKEPITTQKNYTYSTNLIRYSMSRNFELRFITEYIGNHNYNAENKISTKSNGLSPLSIGAKILINEEDKHLPQITMLTNLQLPLLCKKEFSPNGIAPTIKLLSSKTLSKTFTLTNNLGIKWDGNSTNATGIYTLSLNAVITKKLNTFIETYGLFSKLQPNNHSMDVGFTYLISDNLQLDGSGGIGITTFAPDYFLSFGISYRLRPGK